MMFDFTRPFRQLAIGWTLLTKSYPHWEPEEQTGDCSRCQGHGCDGNCQGDWCGSVEDVKY